MEQDRYNSMFTRYKTGQTPWDSETPPPEVIALAEKLPPGRAIDLGCGYGRSASYLAQKGWQVDGVDFIPLAVAGAISRAEEKGVSGNTRFHLGRVTQLPFPDESFDLALDVGCMHALNKSDLAQYRDAVYRILRPGGKYLLFAHLRDDAADVPGRGVSEEMIYALFNSRFTLENVRRGMTRPEGKPAWASAWFWYRRN
jgi:SAM-dependent methyltransferase